MIDDLNHPVCYPVTSIMNGLAIFKKSKFGQKFIFLTQYESTFILLTWSKKILAKRIFEQKGAGHTSALRWGDTVPCCYLLLCPLKA